MKPAVSAAALVFGLLAIAGTSAARGDELADFYAKNGIKLIVGNPPGQGYDAYGRVLAKFMTKHLPGSPNITVMNRPGAGSLTMTNELYNASPRDGSVIGLPNRNVLTEPLFGNEMARYDSRAFNWLGSLNNEVSICGAWYTTGIKSFEDLRTRGMITGGSGVTDDTVVFPYVLNNLTGTKLKIVSGYGGAADINIAVERGELEGRCGMSYSQLKAGQSAWMTEKKFNVVLQLSTAKHPDLPDVPVVTDIASAKTIDALRLIFARQFWGRPIAAPPGVPAVRVAALRKGFIETMRDPEFQEQTQKMGLEINPVEGEAIEAALDKVYQAPKEVIEAARVAMKPPTR